MAVRISDVGGGRPCGGREDHWPTYRLSQGQSASMVKEGAVNCIVDSSGSEVPGVEMGDWLGVRDKRLEKERATR